MVVADRRTERHSQNATNLIRPEIPAAKPVEPLPPAAADGCFEAETWGAPIDGSGGLLEQLTKAVPNGL